MSKKLVSGVYAAAITPRDSDGKLDERALRKELDFLIGRGIRGFAINGATGECCLTTANELSAAVAAAAEVTEGRAEFICGIGSAGVRGCIENGIIAIKGGAQGLLLPTPHFFPYEQDDVEAFCHEVADQLPAPILLYNLPQFTTGFQPDTVMKLISENPTIVGIKDSSGSLDILRTLTGRGIESCRVVGNDRSEEHTSELQSPCNLVCRLLLEKRQYKILLSYLSRPRNVLPSARTRAPSAGGRAAGGWASPCRLPLLPPPLRLFFFF